MSRQPRERVFTLSLVEAYVDLFVLRALVVRDRATTCDVILRRLVTLPDVVLWRVLSYWRATE